ncbi:MAG: ribonuclease J [Chloroflexota bacterium]|nr:ribonuclease J [Chloroflexota bacterium]
MTNSAIKIIPLGGLGDIGRNMMAIEYSNEIVIIDAGVLFADQNMPSGIDFAIPDFSYLRDNSDKIVAMMITHGHEDHIGAIPYFVNEFNVPIYASRLTHGLITVKLRDRGLLQQAHLNVVEPNSPFKIGKFKVEFFRVTHSIPDAMGIALGTKLGHIIHTGDFKIDHTPVDGKSTDFSVLSRLASEGVILLLSDSTYAELKGYTESESIVGEALDNAIGQASGRVMIATFASLISRIQQILTAAAKHGRKVAVVGRSMNNNVSMALKMGYLSDPGNILISLKESSKLPNDETIIVATGSQGEPTSALVRIANGQHPDISVIDGDTVIISASPIPGNETLVAKTIDNLFRKGATVLYSRVALVHVHGHASQEELKMVLTLLKPKFFVPIHGEYRHLTAHAAIAESVGVSAENIFVLEDGEVLEIHDEFGEIIGAVPSNHVLVDGKRFWEGNDPVLNERRLLGKQGIINVAIFLERTNNTVIGMPSLSSYGFLEIKEVQEKFENAAKLVSTYLESNEIMEQNSYEIKVGVERVVSEFIYQETRLNPKVVAIVQRS